MLAGPLVLAPIDAVLAGCKPNHFRPLFFIKSMGACAFDSETMSFAGTPVEQALCLMRGMDASRNLEPQLQSLPAALAERIGQTTGLPSRATLNEYLSTLGLEGEFGDFLWLPVSRGHDNELGAPMARYSSSMTPVGRISDAGLFPMTSTAAARSTTCAISSAMTAGAKRTSSSAAPANFCWRTIIQSHGARPSSSRRLNSAAHSKGCSCTMR